MGVGSFRGKAHEKAPRGLLVHPPGRGMRPSKHRLWQRGRVRSALRAGMHHGLGLLSRSVLRSRRLGRWPLPKRRAPHPPVQQPRVHERHRAARERRGTHEAPARPASHHSPRDRDRRVVRREFVRRAGIGIRGLRFECSGAPRPVGIGSGSFLLPLRLFSRFAAGPSQQLSSAGGRGDLAEKCPADSCPRGRGGGGRDEKGGGGGRVTSRRDRPRLRDSDHSAFWADEIAVLRRRQRGRRGSRGGRRNGPSAPPEPAGHARTYPLDRGPALKR